MSVPIDIAASSSSPLALHLQPHAAAQTMAIVRIAIEDSNTAEVAAAYAAMAHGVVEGVGVEVREHSRLAHDAVGDLIYADDSAKAPGPQVIRPEAPTSSTPKRQE